LLTDVASSPVPYALVVVMLAASALLYVVGKAFLGRGVDAAPPKACPAGPPRPLPPVPATLAAAFFTVIFLLAVLPHLAVLLTSFTATGAWYRHLLPTSFTLDHYSAALVDA